MDETRLRRAEELMEGVEILQATGSVIQAIVNDYGITVDLEKKTVVHNCADWSKSIQPSSSARTWVGSS